MFRFSDFGNREFIKEANTMYDLEHKNIVKLLSVYPTGGEMGLITEFMKDGSLLQFLRGNRAYTLTLLYLI